MRNFVLLSAALLAAAQLGSRAAAEDSPADVQAHYARAATLTRTPLSKYVKNGYVIPHWIKGQDAFWYLRQTATGSEFVVFDAATRSRHVRFSDAAVAGEVSRLLGERITPDALAVQGLDYSPAAQTVSFSVKGAGFECRLDPALACEKAASHPVSAEMSLSPDGLKGVLVRAGNLWLRDIATGHETELTTDGTSENGYGIGLDLGDPHHLVRLRSGAPASPSGVRWSPDSKRLIVPRVDQSGVAAYPYIEYAPFDGSFRPKALDVRLPLAGEPEAALSWVSFDLTKHDHRPIDLPFAKLEMAQLSLIDIDSGSWSRGGTHYFAFLAGHDEHSAHLYDINLLSGATREVVTEAVSPPAIFNAGGYEAPVSRVLKNGVEFLWFSQRDGYGHLYLYDLQTDRLKSQITKGAYTVRDIVKVDEDRRQIYFVVSGLEANPYWRDLCRVNFNGSGFVRISPETGDKLITDPRTPFSFSGAIGYNAISPDGRYALYTVSPINSPPRLILRAADGSGPAFVVETADISALLASGYAPPEEFDVRGADGKSEIYGAIYRPKNYDPLKKYPIIDDNYASPTTTITPHNFTTALGQIDVSTAASWTALGFVVVTVDGRGTPFRGRTFSSPRLGFTASMGLDDHVAAIRALAARDPGLDLGRVGIAGASFGGWSAVRALINYPDFYKVALAGAPPGSWYNMYPATGLVDAYDGVPIYGDGRLERPSSTAKPVNWTASDSIAQIGKIKGKLLILMGGLDENVLPGSTMQLLQAAEDADRNVDFVFNPRGNHGGFYGQYATHKAWDFFVLNLAGERPPNDFQMRHDP